MGNNSSRLNRPSSRWKVQNVNRSIKWAKGEIAWKRISDISRVTRMKGYWSQLISKANIRVNGWNTYRCPKAGATTNERCGCAPQICFVSAIISYPGSGFYNALYYWALMECICSLPHDSSGIAIQPPYSPAAPLHSFHSHILDWLLSQGQTKRPDATRCCVKPLKSPTECIH